MVFNEQLYKGIPIMKNKIDSSRQKTSWDNSDEQTVNQKFIGKVYQNNFKNIQTNKSLKGNNGYIYNHFL